MSIYAPTTPTTLPTIQIGRMTATSTEPVTPTYFDTSGPFRVHSGSYQFTESNETPLNRHERRKAAARRRAAERMRKP